MAELEEKRDLKNRACRCGTNFQRFLRLVSLKTSPLKTENWARGISLKKAKKMPRGYIFFFEKENIFFMCSLRKLVLLLQKMMKIQLM